MGVEILIASRSIAIARRAAHSSAGLTSICAPFYAICLVVCPRPVVDVAIVREVVVHGSDRLCYRALSWIDVSGTGDLSGLGKGCTRLASR